MYQPATEVVDGTCSSPAEVRPSVISWVCTPISGMVSETGAATGFGTADCGGATIGPVGAGSAAAGRHRAHGRGRVPRQQQAGCPPPMTARPAASAIAAAGLRVGIARPRRAADGYGAA